MDKKYSVINYHDKSALLCNWLNEHKAKDVVSLDLQGKNPLTDQLIIASAASARQARALADGVLAYCAEQNFEFLHLEGYDQAGWILADLNDIVVHIFQEEERALYNLESLWRRAESKLQQSREPENSVAEKPETGAKADVE